MKSIYVTAFITTAVVFSVYGGIIFKMKSRVDWRWPLLAFLIVLPLQPLVFYLVRLPFNNWLVGRLGSTSNLYEWITLFYAPLTEEPAKLIPLLVPFIFLDIRKENFVRYALAIGLGFGIGEIWFLAERIASNPSFASFSF
jgi:RsiW-degrading membrane proteinase PrsW (M82 family)